MGKEKIEIGLIGQKLGHSFSQGFFQKYFSENEISDQWSYSNFEIAKASDLESFLASTSAVGFNVTIPYKETILPFLQEISAEAQQVGAVNTLTKTSAGWKGDNTDIIGFANSLKPFLEGQHENALILGKGGASKAVAFILKSLGIDYRFVSRNPEQGDFAYSDINEYVMKHFKLVVNTTPLGMFPNIESKPEIPYSCLTPNHFLYDLVYNPEITSFLAEGIQRGCLIKNGHDMLIQQALASFQIWKSNNDPTFLA
ncbi:MAG: shikimate dehydrogenase [Sphingobacteriales bacterium]|jgi:shikimate dehydrogenase